MNDATKGAATPDPRGETTVLDPKASIITIINTYMVEPERADELIAFLVEATRSTLRHVPGFISANLHVALDRKQVVNYAQWKSPEALAAVRENSQVAALMQEQLRIANSFAPVLYTLRACIPAAT
jgi:quinol monooxygenase YgiN